MKIVETVDVMRLQDYLKNVKDLNLSYSTIEDIIDYVERIENFYERGYNDGYERGYNEGNKRSNIKYWILCGNKKWKKD